MPGAFMSFVAYRLLNKIIVQKQVTDTSEILKQMDESIIEILRQKETNNRDGMDLCLCSIKKKDNSFKINYSGAKRPLCYTMPNDDSLHSIEATHRSIGGNPGSRNKLDYKVNTIELPKNSMLYLTTDGYTDQSNCKRKKIGRKKLLYYFAQIKDKDLETQKKFLYKNFLEWKSNNE